MEDGDDRDGEREDQTAGVDEPIYEDDGNDINEHQIVDEREQDTGNQNDTVDQDAGADDNDVGDQRRGRHQRINETVPDKDVNNLYITNLSFQTTDESLRAVFESYGQITNCQVIKEPITQTSRGFGFVSFYTLEECEKALQAMNGGECDGRLIRVEKAKRNSGYSKTPGVYLGPPQLSSRFGDYKGRLPRDIDPRDFKQRSSGGAAESYPERSSLPPPRQQHTSSHSDRSYPAAVSARDPYLSSGYGGYRGPPPQSYGGRSPASSYRDGDRYDDRYDYNRIPRSSLPPARYEDSRDRRDYAHRSGGGGGGHPSARDYPPYASSSSSYDHRPLSSRRSRSPPPSHLHYDDRRGPPPMSYSSAYYRDGPPPRSSRY